MKPIKVTIEQEEIPINKTIEIPITLGKQKLKDANKELERIYLLLQNLALAKGDLISMIGKSPGSLASLRRAGRPKKEKSPYDKQAEAEGSRL